jgi:hypothetical protein
VLGVQNKAVGWKWLGQAVPVLTARIASSIQQSWAYSYEKVSYCSLKLAGNDQSWGIDEAGRLVQAAESLGGD